MGHLILLLRNILCNQQPPTILAETHCIMVCRRQLVQAILANLRAFKVSG